MDYGSRRRQEADDSGLSEKFGMILIWTGLGFCALLAAVVFIPFIMRQLGS